MQDMFYVQKVTIKLLIHKKDRPREKPVFFVCVSDVAFYALGLSPRI